MTSESEIDWKMQRLGRFTASDCHKLFISGRKKDEFFGVGSMTYIRSKVAELLTLEIKEEIDFRQAEWGKVHEAEAVQAFEAMIGKSGDYYGASNPVFFPYGQYAGGSPDWEIESDEGADIKCPYNSSIHVENLQIQSAEEFKDKRWEYFCQAQSNMLTRGWKRFHFVSYDPRMPEALQLKIITILPDAQWIDEFVTRIKKGSRIIEDIIDSFNNVSLIVCQNESGDSSMIAEIL